MRTAVRRAGRIARSAALATQALQRTPHLTVLGWHRIDSDGGEDGLSTPIDAFCRHLDLLEQWGATVLTLESAARRCVDNTLPERSVVLTFDDGYASIVETAWPLLCERNLPATLFVVSGYLDGVARFPWDAAQPFSEHTRLASDAQVRVAAAHGLHIGSHTVTHRWLPHLSHTELRDELLHSRLALETLLGAPVRTLAYPMGGWNARVRSAAASAGYTVGVTVDRGCNSTRRDPLALRRGIVPTEAEDFRLLLDGAYTWLRPLDSLRNRNGPSW